MGRRRLGKGIDALLQGKDLEQLTNLASIVMVKIDRLSPNPHQPRTRFGEDSLAELADSIREKGVLQPILAEDQGDGTYIIVAGERRYRAARMAGLSEIPVISHDFSDEEKIEIALIENIQREDLNPIDEARAIRNAMDLGGLTQEEIAKRLGKSRSAVANALRLLKLDSRIQDDIATGELTPGHARALLAVSDDAEREKLWRKIIQEKMSVRQAESAGKPAAPATDESDELPADAGSGESGTARTAGVTAAGRADGMTASATKSVELKRLEDQLIRHLGTRVVIRGTDRNGKIEIPYLSTDDLERLLQVMGVELED